MRQFFKILARGLATLVVFPELVSFWLRSWIWGSDRALEASSQTLALVPGTVGRYLRGAFLHYTLAHCDWSASIEFGTIFSQAQARLDENVYVGPRCHLGLVHIERDTLLAAGVHVPSGPETHGTSLTTIPIRDQPGSRTLVRIGPGCWIGEAAVVLADVGRDSIVGAGAVVTKPIPDGVVAVGVPASVLRSRYEAQ